MALSRTTNRLHFTDLDPLRFEDLCLNLLYPFKAWFDIRHYGRAGGDGGIDIFAIEQLKNGVVRNWFVQCRRYKKATKVTLEQAVIDAIKNSPSFPNVLLVVVACDVRRDSQESFYQYAQSKGVEQPLLWTQSILEAKLYSERRDLLFAYFGVNDLIQARSQEATLQHHLELKKRMRKDFQKESYDPQIVLWEPYKRFEVDEAIIHSIDDTSYPKVDEISIGISRWFRVELYNFYFNGIEVVLGGEMGIIDTEGHWSLIEFGQKYDQQKYVELRLFRIGQIPYRNIVEYDIDGDEYYNEPHIYCNFANGGTPYESIRYESFDLKSNGSLKPELQFEYKSKG